MPGKKTSFSLFRLPEQLGEPAAGSGCLAQGLLYKCAALFHAEIHM